LKITKADVSLYAGACDVADADGFGKACADACSKLLQEQVCKESSIGALMEHLSNGVLDQLVGAYITEKVQRIPAQSGK
jgi:hypothetical protein